jgi:plastocyanin
LTIPNRTAAPWRALLGKAVLAAALIAAPAVFAQSAKDSPEASKGRDYTVVMSNMDYGAIPPGLKVGDTIVWVNHDTVIHSITARDHSFDLRINPGQTAKMPLATAGKFPFYCLFHPTMRGTLTVSAK